MTYTVTNNKIAGLSKNDLIYGGFKFVHLYSGTIHQPIWVNEKGKSTLKKDEYGEILRQEVPGIIMYFQYKNCMNKWSGTVITTETGEQSTKGCLKIELALPKTLNSQSKLYKLFVLLGIVARVDFKIDSEETLISDDNESDDLNVNDLTEDVEDVEDVELELDPSRITTDILNHLNKVFLAPFTLNNNYPVISSDFDLWEVPKITKKKK